MKFRFVQEHCTVFPVRRMCAVLDVSPAGYYAWRGRPESYRSCADSALLAEVQRIHAYSNRRYGSPRVTLPYVVMTTAEGAA